MTIEDRVKIKLEDKCIPVNDLEILEEYTKSGNYNYLVYLYKENLHLYKTSNKKTIEGLVLLPKSSYLHSLTFNNDTFKKHENGKVSYLRINEELLKNSKIYLIPRSEYKFFGIPDNLPLEKSEKEKDL